MSTKCEKHYNNNAEFTGWAISRSNRGRHPHRVCLWHSRRASEKSIPALFDVAHIIQQLTRLLEPPPRSFCVLVHARVIRTNFTRSELECHSDFSDMVLEIGPAGKRQQTVQDIRDESDAQTKGLIGVGKNRTTRRGNAHRI